MKPYSDINDPRLIKALAHPLRVRILSILETRDMASPTRWPKSSTSRSAS
jgi:DNA-binding transcriptional ArsR family regulator